MDVKPDPARESVLVSPELTVWRYMQLPQLLHLLAGETIWFSRLDKFDDPTEGSWSQGTFDFWKKSNPWLTEDTFRQFVAAEPRIRRQMYASCWHENTSESLEMWRVYALKGQRSGHTVNVWPTPRVHRGSRLTFRRR